MTAATAATVATPLQVALGEYYGVSFAIIVARLRDKSTQQIEVNLLKRPCGAEPGNFMRMKEVCEQFRAFNHPRPRPREIRIGIDGIDPVVADGGQVPEQGRVL